MNLRNLKKSISFFRYKNISYAQEGEDLVLNRIFEGKRNGFYIDVGAHHPIRFSNTYFFYKLGWKGINIDAMPGSMKAFKLKRPRDINLETPISENENQITYYMFNEPALNGFSKEISEGRDGLSSYKVINKIPMRTHRLDSILDKHMTNGQHIDFLSVDVEGLDLEVLKSNNWKKFQPSYILVEILETSLAQIQSTETYTFLNKNGYELFGKTVNTYIFKYNKY